MKLAPYFIEDTKKMVNEEFNDMELSSMLSEEGR
jgi:hypothetical protein